MKVSSTLFFLFCLQVTAVVGLFTPPGGSTKSLGWSLDSSLTAAAAVLGVRGGDNQDDDKDSSSSTTTSGYGRISADEYRLTPEQIEIFRREGCVTIENVLTEPEVAALERVFDGFLSGDIAPPPGKDFCDMSKPFGVPP